MEMVTPQLLSGVLTLVGGAAGLAVLTFLGSIYHNWYVRKMLRQIEQNTRRNTE